MSDRRSPRPAVALAAFQRERHLPLISEWLRQPHVARWWGDAATAWAEIGAFPIANQAIIEADGQPVGYLCWQRPSPADLEAAGLADLPADLIDVDVMIGATEHLGHGVGPEALSQLALRLQDQGVSTVGLGTSVANERALRAFEKAGFRRYRDFVEAGGAMRYLIRRLHTGTR